MTVDEVFQEIEGDVQYYRNSGGGVTVSGGEPLYQADFATAFFKKCCDAGIHTCLDTCGYAETSDFEKILPYTRLVLFDVKHMDPITHRKLTGRSNNKILKNLQLVKDSGVPVVVRIPVIPTINDSDEDITAIAKFCTNKLNHVHLMPYHRYGTNKYKMLNKRYKLEHLIPPEDAVLQRAKKIFESSGMSCKIQH